MKVKEKEIEALQREHECAIASTQDKADRQFWGTQQELREANAQVGFTFAWIVLYFCLCSSCYVLHLIDSACEF